VAICDDDVAQQGRMKKAHIRLALTILPWKRTLLLLCRPLLVADYTSYGTYALRKHLGPHCTKSNSSEDITYAVLFRAMVSMIDEM
jgi:hypothetical protein